MSDNLRGANSREAKALAGKISQYEGIKLNIREVPVTQQKNAFDCGVHCLVNADRVANHIKDHQSLTDIKALQDPVRNKRTEILELIDKLKNWFQLFLIFQIKNLKSDGAGSGGL